MKLKYITTPLTAIGFVFVIGLVMILIAPTLYSLYENGVLTENVYLGIIYSVPVISIIIVLVWSYQRLEDKRCPHCEKVIG